MISSVQVRYVLDTCVIVAALRSRLGAGNQVLRLVLVRRLAVVLHYKLLAEYRAVLTRLAQQGKLSFTLPQIGRFLAAIVTVAEEIEVRYLWRPNLPDESDNFVYELAFAASPSVIVTHNLRDFESPELHWSGVLAGC